MRALVVCPTYGRLPYLGRMLASFLSQTYSDKTLVIVNDDKNVKLQCNYSNVVCINLDRKILLPEKRNIGISLGKYDVYFNLDDDDVFLPKRISNKIAHHKKANVLSTHDLDSYIVYENEFKYTKLGRNTVCSFTRELFFKVGGYCSDANFGEDREFFNKMEAVGGYLPVEGDMDFVYIYSGVNYHTSYEQNKNYTETIDRIAYDQLVALDVLNKTFSIQPDFNTFNKLSKMDKMFTLNKKPIKVKFDKESEISIVDFEN